MPRKNKEKVKKGESGGIISPKNEHPQKCSVEGCCADAVSGTNLDEMFSLEGQIYAEFLKTIPENTCTLWEVMEMYQNISEEEKAKYIRKAQNPYTEVLKTELRDLFKIRDEYRRLVPEVEDLREKNESLLELSCKSERKLIKQCLDLKSEIKSYSSEKELTIKIQQQKRRIEDLQQENIDAFRKIKSLSGDFKAEPSYYWRNLLAHNEQDKKQLEADLAGEKRTNELLYKKIEELRGSIKKFEINEDKMQKEMEDVLGRLEIVKAADSKNVSDLEKQIEDFETCSICCNAFDDEDFQKYAKYCGHITCFKCFKQDLARQREDPKIKGKPKCHCGAIMHESKAIRLFQ